MSLLESPTLPELRQRLLAIPEIRICVAEELVIRKALERLSAFDFFENEKKLLEEWKGIRTAILPLAEERFQEECGSFIGSDLCDDRRDLFLCALRKFDIHTSEGGENFEPCDFLGGDPYKNCLVDGLPSPIKLGNCISAIYSEDLEHIDRLRNEVKKGGTIRPIEMRMLPFFDPRSFDNPTAWEASQAERALAQRFQEFERNNAIPAYLTANERFTLTERPPGCRIRPAVGVLREAHLPERVLAIYGISLYETDVMVEFAEAYRTDIEEQYETIDRLHAFLIDSEDLAAV